MIIRTINFQKVFPIGVYQNVRMGADVDIVEGEDPESAMLCLKDLVEGWFNKAYPNVGEPVTYAQPEPIEEKKVVKQSPTQKKESQVSNIAIQICTCKELKTLESYRLIVKGKPELKPIYDQKLNELSHELESSKV